MDNNTKIFLILDIQAGFENAFLLSDVLSEIQKARDSIKPDKIVWTQFINHQDSVFEKKLNYSGCITQDEQQLLIQPTKSDRIIKKSSYSAVTQELIEFINEHSPCTVYVCGADTDACILATCYDLFDMGIDFKIIKDACMSSGGKELDIIAKTIMVRNFGKEIFI